MGRLPPAVDIGLQLPAAAVTPIPACLLPAAAAAVTPIAACLLPAAAAATPIAVCPLPAAAVALIGRLLLPAADIILRAALPAAGSKDKIDRILL